MVACPFEIPAYQFEEPLKPKITKCTFCNSNEKSNVNDNFQPACAAVCPTEALLYGERGELLKIAKARVEQNPEKYIDHVYGETEAGGTSWLYLAPVDFAELDLPAFDSAPPSVLTESIQHGLFKYGGAPAAVYGALAALMWFRNRNSAANGDEQVQPSKKQKPEGKSDG